MDIPVTYLNPNCIRSNLDRFKTPECPLGDLVFPKEEGEKLPLSLNFKTLRKVVESQGEVSKVSGVVLFGSASRLHMTRRPYSYLWGLFKGVRGPFLDYRKKPSDIDVLVIAKGALKRVVADLNVEDAYYSDYGSFTTYRHVRNGLDVFILDPKEFDAYLAAGDSVTLSVLEDGVLLLGDFHHPLKSPVHVVYDKDFRPSFVVKETPLAAEKDF